MFSKQQFVTNMSHWITDNGQTNIKIRLKKEEIINWYSAQAVNYAKLLVLLVDCIKTLYGNIANAY
jgi:hypothetical protein